MMERDKNEKQQQQSNVELQSLDQGDRQGEGGIDLSRDEFGRSPIQTEEATLPTSSNSDLVNPSDMDAQGGSSSEHTRTQSDASARHRQPGSAHLDQPETDLSRGDAFDQAQGGGRGADEVD